MQQLVRIARCCEVPSRKLEFVVDCVKLLRCGWPYPQQLVHNFAHSSMTMALTSEPSSTSFFSGLLAPSLLSLSPLQSIVQFLHDQDAVRFCRVNKDHYQTIYPRMRLIEPHALTTEVWNRLEVCKGPLVTTVQLNDLIELEKIPNGLRCQLRRIIFRDVSRTITRDLIPPLLEEFETTDELILSSQQLPILPATLKKLVLGWKMSKPRPQSAATTATTITVGSGPAAATATAATASTEPIDTHGTAMFARILSEVSHLTDVTLVVFDKAIISVLPSTVERLELHMASVEMPQQWPASLTRLSVQYFGDMRRFPLGAFAIPKSLLELVMPKPHRYTHYDEVLQSITPESSLTVIQFGPGFSDCQTDIFARLPRHVTHVSYAGPLEFSDNVRVESLPDTVIHLSFPLTDRAVTRWPPRLREIWIPSYKYVKQDISNLPDSVTSIKLMLDYANNVSKWPHSLTELHTGTQFVDLPSLSERLPQCVKILSVTIPIARRMIASGTLPKSLTQLNIAGVPDPGKPFDLRLLPESLRELTIDGGVEIKDHSPPDKLMPECGLLGMNDRPNLIVHVTPIESVEYDVNEIELETRFVIMSDPAIASPSVNDPEESVGWLSPRDDDGTPAKPTPARLASDPFYAPESVMRPFRDRYELDIFNSQKEQLNIARLDRATSDAPLNGIHIHGMNTPAILSALGNAFTRDAITGCVNIDTAQLTFSSRDQLIPTPKDWINVFESLGHSKHVTELKIASPGSLFEFDDTGTGIDTATPVAPAADSPVASSSWSLLSDNQQYQQRAPPPWVALCHSITRMKSLRTLIFDSYYEHHTLLHQITAMLLLPECASIEELRVRMDLAKHFDLIVDLVTRTHTLRHLDLSYTCMRTCHLWRLCKALVKNDSLRTLDLSLNYFHVAGIHALRWVLRQNRGLIITIKHSDFGTRIENLFAHQRHQRLKESRL